LGQTFDPCERRIVYNSGSLLLSTNLELALSPATTLTAFQGLEPSLAVPSAHYPKDESFDASSLSTHSSIRELEDCPCPDQVHERL
jgi:hypothetical protein